MFEKLRQQIEIEIPVSVELMQQLKLRGTVLQIYKNEYVLQAGQVCDYGYFIHHGSFMHLHVNEKGKESITGFAIDEAYGFFSSPESYFTRQPSAFGIRALEDSVVIRYSRVDLDEMSAAFPEFCTFYHKIIAHGFITLYKFSSLRLSLTSKEFLIYLYNEQPIYLKRIPDKYIALFMGVSKEWLCKLKTRILRS
jgi:CRP/FNR family transcriptional regulator, anaerobic regulatory protein